MHIDLSTPAGFTGSLRQSYLTRSALTTSLMYSRAICGFSSVPRLRRDSSEPQTAMTSHIASLHLNEWGASMFPAWLREEGLGIEGDGIQRRPNLSPDAEIYLQRIGADVEDLFHHVLTMLHDPAYRESNAGALRMEWPRIPVPGWPDGADVGAADELAESGGAWPETRRAAGLGYSSRRSNVWHAGVLGLRSSRCHLPRMGAIWTATTST